MLPYQITRNELMLNLVRLDSQEVPLPNEQVASVELTRLSREVSGETLSDDQAFDYSMAMIGLLESCNGYEQINSVNWALEFLKQHVFPNCADKHWQAVDGLDQQSLSCLQFRDKAKQPLHSIKMFDDLVCLIAFGHMTKAIFCALLKSQQPELRVAIMKQLHDHGITYIAPSFSMLRVTSVAKPAEVLNAVTPQNLENFSLGSCIDLIEQFDYHSRVNRILFDLLQKNWITMKTLLGVAKSVNAAECERAIWFIHQSNPDLLSNQLIVNLSASDNIASQANFYEAVVTQSGKPLTITDHVVALGFDETSPDELSSYISYFAKYQPLKKSTIRNLFELPINKVREVYIFHSDFLECTKQARVDESLEVLLSDPRLAAYSTLLHGHWEVFAYCPQGLTQMRDCQSLDEASHCIGMLETQLLSIETANHVSLILRHPNLPALANVRKIIEGISIPYKTLAALLHCEQIEALAYCLAKVSHSHQAGLNADLLLAFIQSEDMKGLLERKLSDWEKALTHQEPEVLDSAGISIVDQADADRWLAPDQKKPADEEAALTEHGAARRIQQMSRHFLHYRLIRSAKRYGGDEGLSFSKTDLPSGLSFLLNESLPAIYKTTTHGSSSLARIHQILDGGTLYCGAVLNTSQLAEQLDIDIGDQRRVCTSPKGVHYTKSWHYIQLKLDRLVTDNYNLGPATFKLHDWPSFQATATLFVFKIAPHLKLEVISHASFQIDWELFDGERILAIGTIPKAAQVIHGLKQMDRDLTLLLPRIVNQVPSPHKEKIVRYFLSLSKDALIKHCQNFAREFPYSEISFQQLRIRFDMLASIKLNDRVYDFDALRGCVEKDDGDGFVERMGDFALQKVFYTSHPLAIGLLQFAEQQGASNIAAKCQALFSKALSLKAGIALPRPLPERSMLLDAVALENMNKAALTPSQIDYLVDQLPSNVIEARLRTQRLQIAILVDAIRTSLEFLLDISKLGFQTSLRLKTFSNTAFRRLLETKDNVFNLLCAMAALQRPEFSALSPQGFNDRLLQTERNIYTGTQLTLNLTGISAADGKKNHNNFLSSLFETVPPIALMVPYNASKSRASFPSEMVMLDFQFYQTLCQHLREIAIAHHIKLPKPLPHEALLHEAYDDTRWDEYIRRYQRLANTQYPYSIDDGCEGVLRNIAPLSFIYNLSATRPYLSHFFLDTKHCLSVLQSNYGGKRSDFYQILTHIQREAEGKMSYGMQITAMQLFCRLILLESSDIVRAQSADRYIDFRR